MNKYQGEYSQIPNLMHVTAYWDIVMKHTEE